MSFCGLNKVGIRVYLRVEVRDSHRERKDKEIF